MAGANDQAGTPGSETPTEAEKKLQRLIEKGRQREKVYQEQAAQALNQSAQIKELVEGQKTLVELIAGSGMVDDAQALAAKQALGAGKQSNDSAAALSDIMQDVYEAETMWDDDRLSGARQAWSQGNYTEAAKLVREALTNEGTEDERIEAEVAKRVATKGAMGVDTEGSTAMSSNATLNDPDSVEKALAGPEGRAFWKANKEKIMENVKSGRLPVA